MTALKPNFPGFPAVVSPFTVTWADQKLDPQDSGRVLQEFDCTVTIAYDNATGVLAATGTAHRDPGAKWKTLRVGAASVPLPVGDSVFNTADLGVSTIAQLNAAGVTVDSK
jgi:hypothetical protein